MNKKPYLSVIISAYNEVDNLMSALIDIDKCLQGINFDYEILVINNDSKDTTEDMLSKLKFIIKQVRIINNKNFDDKSSIWRIASSEAMGEYLFFIGIKNIMTANNIAHIISSFSELLDMHNVILGTRSLYHSFISSKKSFYSIINDCFEYIITKLLFLSKIRGIRCEFLCLSALTFRKILPILKTRGVIMDMELLLLALKSGYKIREISLVWTNYYNFVITLSVYLSMIIDVFKIRFWLLTNQYKLILI